jgi:hypothetical protein
MPKGPTQAGGRTMAEFCPHSVAVDGGFRVSTRMVVSVNPLWVPRLPSRLTHWNHFCNPIGHRWASIGTAIRTMQPGLYRVWMKKHESNQPTKHYNNKIL